MKSTSPTGNDMVQYFSSTAYNGIPSRVTSNFQRNFGLGLGFNSPKNDPQKVITLSTKVTGDISRYSMQGNKPNGILERKNSRTTPDATPKGSPYMSSSLVRADPSSPGISNTYKPAESRGSSADKRKNGNSSATMHSSSKQTPVYRPSSSRGGQKSLRKELGHSVKSKKLEINTNNNSENIVGPIRSRSTKNQETSQNFLNSGTIKKNNVPFDSTYKLLTSATPPNRHAPTIAFSHKTKTEPNEERGLRGSSALKSKQGTINRPFGGSAVYSSTTATRDSSKERESVSGQEREKQKITLNGNRKIGFSSNGQLKYTTLGQGQGVIKANNFFSSSASNWGHTVSGRDKNKPDYKANAGAQDLTKSANFEKKSSIKTQDLRQSLRFPEKKGTQSYKASEENKQQKNQENEDTELPKQVSLQSFVTKVNQGDMLSTMKKSIADREVKSTRNSAKPVLAFDDKNITNNGSNSVRDGIKSTKHSDLKVQTYNQNRNSQPNSAQDQPKQRTKSSKPSTPTLKNETKEVVHELHSAHEKKPFIYFMTSLENHHQEYDESNYFCQIYREHFLQTFQAMMFCKYLKPVDSKVLALKKMHLPRKDFHKDKKTLIFDLDETLIHCNESTAIPSDVILPIRFPHGEIIEAGINVRPYAIEILKELSQYYEIVVFTASHSCYANVVLDYLDPQGQYIQHRLFREHCMPTEEGVYVKDLRVIANRNMQDMILVDNAAYSFGYQIENGIPIVPFYDNKDDLELKHLIPYLKFLSSAKDPREINKITFKLHMYSQYPTPEQVLDNVIFQN